jgi:small subunit ribosomal protein S16
LPVKIRLARYGKKKVARYRIVVADSRSPRDGRFIETVGTYNPQADPKEFAINIKRMGYWLSQGAEVSGTVKNLLDQDHFSEKREVVEKGLDISKTDIERKPERKRKLKPKVKKES